MSAGTLTEVGPFGDKGSILDAKTITAVWYAEVNATSGSVSPPPGGTIVGDRFASGVSALCSTITTTLTPDLEAPVETDGTPVFVSSFTVGTGAFVLSGTPSSFPVAVIFAYDISLGELDNTKNLVAVDLDGNAEVFSGALSNYTEPATTVTITSGVGSYNMATGKNRVKFTMIEATALTISNFTADKALILEITHSGGPHALTTNTVLMDLTGAAGETERVTLDLIGTTLRPEYIGIGGTVIPAV